MTTTTTVSPPTCERRLLRLRSTREVSVLTGVLGIFVFKELRDKDAIIVFFVGAVSIVTGATILGLYGPEHSENGSGESD